MKRLLPYLHYLKPVLPQLVLAVLVGLIYGATGGFALPALIKELLPIIFETPAGLPTQELVFYCCLPAILSAVRGLAGFFNTYLLGLCSAHVTIKIQEMIFERLQRLPIAVFQKYKDGDLITRANADVHFLRTALVELVQEIIKQPTQLIGSIAYLGWLCYQKTNVLFLLVLVAFIPLCIIPIRMIGRNMKRRAFMMQDQTGRALAHVTQNLRATREVRAYLMEESEMRKYSAVLEDFRKFFLKIAKYNVMLTPIIETVAALGIGLALFYAYHSKVQIQDFSAAMLALFMCYEPVKRLGTLHNRMQQGLASLDRIEELLREPITIADPEKPVTIGRFRGEVEFRGVNFAYAQAPVLQGVSAQLAAGRTYALVGPSGAGKSTFANLIPRFYDAAGGAVLIDGIDIRQMRLRDLRRNIAIVAQEPVLFDDTIYNNILIGNPQATREQVLDAARRAYAHDFISELEKGYETQAGQAGSRLSGGQRQRIALARAFLKDAPILILDEATSALDAMSEQYIQQALAELMRGRTVIIIAHRFSSIQHADRILVFEQGRIVETGNHNELLERGGLYANLYRTQSGGLVRD
jgi:subfamily B ATP-binding cassette protein MsbA